MLRALRVVSVERGHDPRDFALVAFGGAGPLHACALAEELGIATVLVPEAAGVLSALGLVASDERRDPVTAYVCPLEEAGELPAEGEADLATAGQSFELTVPLGADLARALPPRARGALRATPTGRGSSSSSRCGRRTCDPGPQIELPGRRAAARRGPGSRSSSTAPPAGSPRVGGG